MSEGFVLDPIITLVYIRHRIHSTYQYNTDNTLPRIDGSIGSAGEGFARPVSHVLPFFSSTLALGKVTPVRGARTVQYTVNLRCTWAFPLSVPLLSLVTPTHTLPLFAQSTIGPKPRLWRTPRGKGTGVAGAHLRDGRPALQRVRAWNVAGWMVRLGWVSLARHVEDDNRDNNWEMLFCMVGITFIGSSLPVRLYLHGTEYLDRYLDT